MFPVFKTIKSFYHFLWAFFSALFYGFPSKNLKVIGITGTQGKSTVVELASKILEEGGFKIASLSSIKIKIGKEEKKNLFKMTMPGRGFLQRFLWKAKKEGCQYVILEVTSEGILQHRQKFIDFDIACFTNLFPEHIERHGSFEKYREAKGKLFQLTKELHIINLDDKNAEFFSQFPANKKWGFTLRKTILPQQFHRLVCGTIISDFASFPLVFSVNQTNFNLNLLGEFNIYNALAAICVGLSQGIGLKTCKSALEKVKTIPGRMEEVISQPFKVIVDYAHTPDALQKVYSTLSGNSKLQKPKLICVLGACGGGRDKWKRPKLGEIAKKFCDKIILTNEDPYNENPNQILSQLKAGISNFSSSNLFEILERREAIRKALSLAKPGDRVIITGKGSEPWMCLAYGRKIPWDDRKIVKEEFKRIYGKI